ncbi:MAG: FtsW/RodA/SpoVE family cell cycle protein [Actinomycetaceae bacterium]|nr:FtsW/RodA/SpoVE family cell cycle protein [Actinomycetaceae bacterium]
MRLRIPRLPAFVWENDGRQARKPSAVTTYYLILVPVVCLILVGLIMVFSASVVTDIARGLNPYKAYLRNLAIMSVGVVGMSIGMLLPPIFWQRIAVPVLAISAGLQMLVPTSLGIEIGGNRNWLKLPGLPPFQPAEILKLALILFLGWVVVKASIDRTNPIHIIVNIGLPVAGSLGLVMLGHDLGTALIFVALATAVLLAIDIPGRWYWVLGLFAGAFLAYYAVSKTSRMERILDSLGFGLPSSISAPEQIDHSKWALGAGGLTGLGPGASREKWNYLSAASTDFIFAILGEELGLIGTLFVVACFTALAFGFYRLTVYHHSVYGRVVSAGIGGWILSQAIVNMGMVVDLTPVIGVPLPLVSTGGTAFIITCMAFAVVLSIARHDEGMEKAFGMRAVMARVSQTRPRQLKESL